MSMLLKEKWSLRAFGEVVDTIDSGQYLLNHSGYDPPGLSSSGRLRQLVLEDRRDNETEKKNHWFREN